MPLYEYECDQCGHHFEVIRKFSDPPFEKCPKCGGHVRKLQSAPAFHLKGTGWYATDYAKKDQSTSSKSDSGSNESTPEKKEGSSEKSDTAKSDTASTKSSGPTDSSTASTPPAKKD